MTTSYDQNVVAAFDSIQPLVASISGLNVSVGAFAYVLNGTAGTYAGVTSVAVTDNATSFLYIDSGGLLQITTSGYPADDAVIKIARVEAASGAFVRVIHDRSVVGFKPTDSTAIPLLISAPSAPSAGFALIYGRMRHGRAYLDMQGSNGRDFPFQPFLGLNKVIMHIPETGTTIRVWGMPVTSVGTVSHPTLASTNLRTSMRRWRQLSAASANSASENRAAATQVWRGNAAGRGGFTFITRVGFATLSANCRGFFGLLSATGATSTSQNPSALTNCLGFAWNATETNLFFQHNDASGTATRIDLGSNFPTNDTSIVYTMFVYSSPNGSDISYRIVREDTGDVADGTVSTDIPASTTFLTYHNYMNNGGDASAIAYECAGVYLESDY